MTSRKELKLVLMNPQYVSSDQNGYIATDDAPEEIKEAVALVNANKKKNPHYYELRTKHFNQFTPSWVVQAIDSRREKGLAKGSGIGFISEGGKNNEIYQHNKLRRV